MIRRTRFKPGTLTTTAPTGAGRFASEVPATSARRGKLRPPWRKAILTAHIVGSVGWLGSAYALLVLGVEGILAVDPAVRLACYQLVSVFDQFFNLPFAAIMVVTGLTLAIGGRWGLVRHRWIIAKLVMSIAVGLTNQRVVVPTALAVIERVRVGADPGALPLELVAASAAAVAILSAVTAIAVTKPWGRTRWGSTRISRRTVAAAQAV